MFGHRIGQDPSASQVKSSDAPAEETYYMVAVRVAESSHGLGLFATRRIDKGELFLEERPIVVIDQDPVPRSSAATQGSICPCAREESCFAQSTRSSASVSAVGTS